MVNLTMVHNSSSIKGFAYDSANKVLHLQFASGGKVYPHYDVPSSVFDEFLAAESMGQFVGKHIRGKFPTTKPAETAT